MNGFPGSLAIVGAGWLGSEVARRAVAEGIRVRATTRSGRWRGAAVEGASLLELDVVTASDDALASVLDGIEVAVFCWAPSGDQDRGTLYVEGARRAARVCRSLDLSRVVYTSSTSALASIDGWLDEDSDLWPESARGRIQREAEEAMSRGLGDVAWTILRLAGLYGPGRELARLYRVDEEHLRAGDGLEHTNLVHLDDAANAVLAATRLPAGRSGVIHVCDDDHRSRREVADAVARRIGLVPPRWEEPAGDRAPRGKRVANERMKTELGLSLIHPTHH